MQNKTSSVPTCALKVDIRCCTGCRVGAKKKLQRIPGVRSIVYDTEERLMTVSGDVNPMVLINKLAKFGKIAKLVSVQNDHLLKNTEGSLENSSNSSISSSHNCVEDERKDQSPVDDQKKTRKKGFLLGLFVKKICGTKMKPLEVAGSVQSSKWQFPVRRESAKAWPLADGLSLNPQAMYGGGKPQ